MATKQNGSVVKSFDILGLIRPDRGEITANIVETELGMTVATAHRFLTTLATIGVLSSYRRGYYCLGPRIEELGEIEQKTNPLALIVKPIIEKLSSELNESVMASRFSVGGPICMAVSTSSRPFNVDIKVGTFLPLHSTAQGKIWLSYLTKKERSAHLSAYQMISFTKQTLKNNDTLEEELTQIREQGFALNKGENEPGLGAVSVPVKSKGRGVLLTLSTFGMLSRFDDVFVEKAVVCLKQAANEIRKNMA